MRKLQKLSIFDTTLRDGEQAPGNQMTVDQKVEMARVLDDLGVNVIEAGFPASSLVDFKAIQRIAKETRNAKICAFARSKPGDIECAIEALQLAHCFQVELLAVGSDIHLKYRRRMSREEAIREAVEAVCYARKLGANDVSLGVEDASRGDLAYLRELTTAGIDAGATMVVIADTVGVALPHEFGNLTRVVKSWIGQLPLSVHCHNDLGLALANTLAAIEAGANEVQTTLCGIGERAGNLALEELIAALLVHNEHFCRETTIHAEKIYEACRRLIDMIGLPMSRQKPIVGDNAFATEAGIHQQGIIGHPMTYECIDPSIFGRKRRLLIGRHSGHHILEFKLREEGIITRAEVLDLLYKRVVESDSWDVFNDSKELAKLYRSLEIGYYDMIAG